MQIYKHSKQIFKGTKYENDWYFYHDALSFMTCKQCQDFMIKQDIYKHWILPLHNINAGTVYAGRPVGNTPEIMPLDSNLNKDIHEAVKTHSTYTNTLDRKDPKKFSISTAKRGQSAYRRVWDPSFGPDGGVPSIQRIMQDVDRIFDEVIMKLVEARGVAVRGIGKRRGRRDDENMKLPRGGKHVKSLTFSSPWIHPDSSDCVRNIINPFNSS